MPIQWNLVSPTTSAPLIEPREIYSSLGERKWDRLRPEQTEVLDEWFQRRNTKDLVIKQNTGSGKTLTGLLIALSSLHENIGPAAFLVPNTYLIKQAENEAHDAGILVTTNEDDLNFQASKAILITTFHKLFNARSVFGVRGIRSGKVSLGTIVVDDAHTAIHTSETQFSTQIPSNHKAFNKILSLFAEDLEFQSLKSYRDIVGGEPGGPIGVPFWATAAKANDLIDIISKYAADPEDSARLYFRWPLIANHLPYSTITVTSESIEIRSPCPDTGMLLGFENAKRRVYLSATLQDESVLVTELGADPDSVARPITPKRASDLGDRIILAPRLINPQIPDDSVQQLARRFADGDRDGHGPNRDLSINVVVLVPSDHIAETWAHVADEILHVNDMNPYIDRLKSGEHLGVVVLVNKYDGIDLSGDACRMLIIDGVPSPATPYERRAAEALELSATYRHRFVSKLEQGMGRGTRDISDYCAVLVLTSEAALTLNDENQMAHFTPGTRAQIKLSAQVAGLVQGQGIGAMSELLDSFLRREQEWTRRSLEATAQVTYERDNRVSDLAAGRRNAFNLIRNGDAQGAVRALRSAIDGIEGKERCWYLEELATYQHIMDQAGAQKTLEAARQGNLSVLMPRRSATQARSLPARSAPQAEKVAERLSELDVRVLELEIETLFDHIAWGTKGSASRAEAQMQKLGSLMGFESSRPERDFRDGGPDNLWAMPNGRLVVIELKTEIERGDTRIIKSEAEQIGHSVNWAVSKYGNNVDVLPVLVHPSNKCKSDAQLPPGARIITRKNMEALKGDILTMVRELINSDDFSHECIADALRRNQLTTDSIIPRHSLKPSQI
ncbi:DEAD/DEAH box helicase family protein [Actinomyces ruminicola]|uniref:Helicase C-terminal domain-containing protein n=1 Tax=Actinomyces ruminicola TaxID=332524 RepID=A0A1G9RS87_9ACTO|nr:DEAD/DEAH box helicase family protein [Actinomyces ruminicola]SDM26081.1 Helicase C-terminal domain-containing protein [Actinomyces ruminicola]